MSVVSGASFSRKYAIQNLFTHNKEEPAEIGFGYWLAKDNQRATFILNLGCQLSFDGIELVNTRNGEGGDRSTKRFR